MHASQPDRPTATPPALVAVAIAARKTGDRDLERAALRELRDTHGIRLSFFREPADRQEARRA